MRTTPNAERIHIGIFGQRNAGKSSFLNTLTGQQISIVSDIKGTTTDPVYKAMEIPGLGPVVWIDTAGFDDEGYLGILRMKKTTDVIKKCDVILFLLSDESDMEKTPLFKDKKVIFILSKADQQDINKRIKLFDKLDPILFTQHEESSKQKVLQQLKKVIGEQKERTITGDFIKANDTVILVMPQKEQAPKGRLILPQAQTIRELLDKNANVLCLVPEQFKAGINTLKVPPKLIITDSQCFREVYTLKPENCPLTSFSVLFSAYKGDIQYFVDSVYTLDHGKEHKRILIAEACTHPPIQEDIGTIKIPHLLRQRFGENCTIDFTRGDDWESIEKYDLIVQCGSCMFNREHVLSRIKQCKERNIPCTNYGILIAYLQGILDKIYIPNETLNETFEM